MGFTQTSGMVVQRASHVNCNQSGCGGPTLAGVQLVMMLAHCLMTMYRTCSLLNIQLLVDPADNMSPLGSHSTMTALRCAHPTRACHAGRRPAVRYRPKLPRFNEHTTLPPTSQIVMYRGHSTQSKPDGKGYIHSILQIHYLNSIQHVSTDHIVIASALLDMICPNFVDGKKSLILLLLQTLELH